MATILVAANDPVLRSIVLTALAGAGHIAVEAVDGASAQSVLSTICDIDLVVVGLGPPDVDGLTLLRQERERGLTTPAIILTADSSLAVMSREVGQSGDRWLASESGVGSVVIVELQPGR